LTAIALQSPQRISLSVAAVASIAAFPALLPYRLIGFAPNEITWLWRQLSAPLAIGQLASFLVVTGLVCSAWGLVIDAAWGLAPPIAIAERVSATVSLDRSWRLLRNKRWLFVGLLVAISVTEALPSLVAPSVALQIIRNVPADQLAGRFRSFYQVVGAVETVFSTAFHLVLVVMIAAFYKVRLGEDSGENETVEAFA
jgi:hypothetical protein